MKMNIYFRNSEGFVFKKKEKNFLMLLGFCLYNFWFKGEVKNMEFGIKYIYIFIFVNIVFWFVIFFLCLEWLNFFLKILMGVFCLIFLKLKFILVIFLLLK